MNAPERARCPLKAARREKRPEKGDELCWLNFIETDSSDASCHRDQNENDGASLRGPQPVTVSSALRSPRAALGRM